MEKKIELSAIQMQVNLSGTPVFLSDKQVSWLIKQAESLIKIEERWRELEFRKPDEIDNFYGDVQDILSEEQYVCTMCGKESDVYYMNEMFCYKCLPPPY